MVENRYTGGALISLFLGVFLPPYLDSGEGFLQGVKGDADWILQYWRNRFIFCKLEHTVYGVGLLKKILFIYF